MEAEEEEEEEEDGREKEIERKRATSTRGKRLINFSHPPHNNNGTQHDFQTPLHTHHTPRFFSLLLYDSKSRVRGRASTPVPLSVRGH